MSMLNQLTNSYFISCQTQHIIAPFHPIKHMQHHTSIFYSKSFNHVTQTPKTQKRTMLEHVSAPISLKLGALIQAREIFSLKL